MWGTDLSYCGDDSCFLRLFFSYTSEIQIIIISFSFF